MTMTSKDCEFLLRTRTKPDLEPTVKCSLTGRTCFCEDTNPAQCTRRTFALSYQAKHPTPI